jgi:hydrogenase maturation protease
MVDPRGAAPTRRLVIGIGNFDRGDDAAGRLVSRLLQGRLPQDVQVVEHDGEASRLLALLATAQEAYFIDAAASGAPAGSVRRFDCDETPLPEMHVAVSTHGLGLAAAIELARALRQLPRRCVVYSIEAASVAAGASLSDEVRSGAQTVVRELVDELWRPSE